MGLDLVYMGWVLVRRDLFGCTEGVVRSTLHFSTSCSDWKVVYGLAT
jgi:hypothetical protein